MCRRIGEYISLELICFVNLTSSCSLMPLLNEGFAQNVLLFLFCIRASHSSPSIVTFDEMSTYLGK